MSAPNATEPDPIVIDRVRLRPRTRAVIGGAALLGVLGVLSVSYWAAVLGIAFIAGYLAFLLLATAIMGMPPLPFGDDVPSDAEPPPIPRRWRLGCAAVGSLAAWFAFAVFRANPPLQVHSSFAATADSSALEPYARQGRSAILAELKVSPRPRAPLVDPSRTALLRVRLDPLSAKLDRFAVLTSIAMRDTALEVVFGPVKSMRLGLLTQSVVSPVLPLRDGSVSLMVGRYVVQGPLCRATCPPVLASIHSLPARSFVDAFNRTDSVVLDNRIQAQDARWHLHTAAEGLSVAFLSPRWARLAPVLGPLRVARDWSDGALAILFVVSSFTFLTVFVPVIVDRAKGRLLEKRDA